LKYKAPNLSLSVQRRKAAFYCYIKFLMLDKIVELWKSGSDLTWNDFGEY